MTIQSVQYIARNLVDKIKFLREGLRYYPSDLIEPPRYIRLELAHKQMNWTDLAPVLGLVAVDLTRGLESNLQFMRRQFEGKSFQDRDIILKAAWTKKDKVTDILELEIRRDDYWKGWYERTEL